ncbi:MAG TPA: DUF4115 domain-containing protein [Acidimicrobiales bacterium]|nr:DUF4115 domain-containing protein [Acidimicrobiales bacterium]
MVLVVLAVVAVVAAVSAAALHRRGKAEIHSVESYRHALHTLRTVRDRTSGGGTVRLLGPAGSARDEPDPAAGVEVGRRAHEHAAAGGSVLRFDDTDVRAPVPGRDARADLRRKDRAMAELARGRRRLAAPVLVAGAVAVLVAALTVVVTHRPGARVGSTPADARSRTPHRPATTSAAAGGERTASGGRQGGSHASAPRSTPQPASTAPGAGTGPIQPTTSSATAASYPAPAASYTLTLASGNGACWWQVQSQPAGSVLWTGTLPAGQQQSVPATGAVTVVVGAPSVASLSLDGRPLVLPAQAQAPLRLTITPPG